MKKFLLTLVCVLSSVIAMQAKEVTIDLSKLTNSFESVEQDGVTVAITRNNTSNSYYDESLFRFYANDVLKFTATSDITSVTVTASSEKYAKALKAPEGVTLSVSGTVGTFTPNEASKEISITNSGQVRISSIVVTLADGPGTPSKVATPTFSVESGSVEAGTTVEILCATEDATIYYALNDGEYSLYENAITINEETNISAYAEKEGMTKSATATANYTIKVEGEETATFDFVNKEYGMTRFSGTSQEYNPDPCTIQEGDITITLNGKTRLWSDGLRFYVSSSFTVTVADGYELDEVILPSGAKFQEATTRAAGKTYNCTVTSKNAPLANLTVKYHQTTTAISEIEAAEGEAIYYDLMGRKVANPEKGLYIRVINGKAVKVVL